MQLPQNILFLINFFSVLFWKKCINQQNVEFLDYSDNSDIRSEWKFETTKNYPSGLLFPYRHKETLIVKNLSAPGEMGLSIFRNQNLVDYINKSLTHFTSSKVLEW